MSPIVFFAVALLVPLALAYFLRVNAALLFMSLCVGAVLIQFVSSDSASVLSAVAPRGNVSSTTVKLVLLFLPPVLTALFTFHSIRGHGKRLLNLLPALGVGVLAILLVEPLLSGNMQIAIVNSKEWQQLYKSQTFAVAASAFLSLAFLWFQRTGSGKESKHRPHAKKGE